MRIEQEQDKLVIYEEFNAISGEILFDYFHKTFKLTGWLANEVRKTPQGFELQINLPLHTIILPVTIISIDKPNKIEFLWESEYVMEKSHIEIVFEEIDESVKVKIAETGNFSGSRWKDPQSIHIDIWKNGLSKLKEIIV